MAVEIVLLRDLSLNIFIMTMIIFTIRFYYYYLLIVFLPVGL